MIQNFNDTKNSTKYYYQHYEFVSMFIYNQIFLSNKSRDHLFENCLCNINSYIYL